MPPKRRCPVCRGEIGIEPSQQAELIRCPHCGLSVNPRTAPGNEDVPAVAPAAGAAAAGGHRGRDEADVVVRARDLRIALLVKEDRLRKELPGFRGVPAGLGRKFRVSTVALVGLAGPGPAGRT